LTQYKHSAPKTTFEIWVVENISGPFEKNFIPEHWTPNIVTLIGQVPQAVIVYLLLTRVGTTLSTADEMNPSLIMLAAISVQMFSQFDIMDGQRARR